MRLWADFNDIRGDAVIEADLEFAQFYSPIELAVGAIAEVFDGAGHECRAVVESYDPSAAVLQLRINWETWRSPETERRRQYAAGPLAIATLVANSTLPLHGSLSFG